MDKKECEVCMRMIKQKHKHDKFYRIGFWIVLVLLAVVSTLYFTSGDLFKSEVTNKEIVNEVAVENNGNGNNSNNIVVNN